MRLKTLTLNPWTAGKKSEKAGNQPETPKMPEESEPNQVEMGKMNRLLVVKSVDFGVYLDGLDLDEILLPSRYVPKGCQVDDWLDVFIYRDSEDRPIAITEQPLAMVGDCKLLQVVEVNNVGAFLDWGLPKELMAPFAQQATPMQKGHSYVVWVYVDNSGRIAASSKLHKFLPETGGDFQAMQQVSLLIFGRTDLGYKAVIDGTHLGMIYHDDVFRKLTLGQSLPGFIKEIRADGKINLRPGLPGSAARTDLATKILEHLKAAGGTSSLTDKSPPADIYQHFSVSKREFKQALGGLYKKRLINIEKDKISLL